MNTTTTDDKGIIHEMTPDEWAREAIDSAVDRAGMALKIIIDSHWELRGVLDRAGVSDVLQAEAAEALDDLNGIIPEDVRRPNERAANILREVYKMMDATRAKADDMLARVSNMPGVSLLLKTEARQGRQDLDAWDSPF